MTTESASLYDRQIELEQESVFLGQQRYDNTERLPWDQKDRTGRDEAATMPGQRLLKATLEPTAHLIYLFMEEASKGGAGRKHSAVYYLAHIDPMQAAYLTARQVINAAATQKTLNTASQLVASAVEDHLNLAAVAKEHPGLYRKVSDQLKSSTSATHRMGVYRAVQDKYTGRHLKWDTKERALLGSKLIELFVEATGAVEIVRDTRGRNDTPILLRFSPEWAEKLRKGHEQCALLSPINLPMIHPPRPWVNPYRGGYLSEHMKKTLVQTRSREYLDELGSLELGPVMAAVNAVQATPWRINKAVLEVMQEMWNSNTHTPALPPPYDAPLPPRPTGLPPVGSDIPLTVEQTEELKVWKAKASKVHTANAKRISKRALVAQRLYVAGRFKDEAAIYFPHFLDFRGRVYPFANYLNPQGDDLAKGLLQFAVGKPLGEAGGYWLKVHIANLFGVDKVDFADRVAWTEAHAEQLLDSALNPLDGQRFWETADNGSNAFQALAACFEFLGYSLNGASHVSHISVAMDGSCSGLQHYSALLRDPVGGAAVNLVPSGRPADVYTAVGKAAQGLSDVSGDAYSSAWLGKVCRKIAKQPTMTLCYAATQFGMQNQIESALEKLDEDNGGRYLNGDIDNNLAARYMAGIVWQAIGTQVVAARAAMDWLKEAAKVAASVGLPIRWSSPLGLPVVQAYRKAKGEKLNVFVDGVRMRMTVVVDTLEIDSVRQASGIAPNFVHSLDAAHLMRTALMAQEYGISSLAVIHDSFGSHAADIPVLNAVIREAFIEQYTPNLLEKFKDEIAEQLGDPSLVEKLPPLPPMGTLELDAIRDAEFFFA
jgi:DNA-directed RNA polymerase, mitochondrial